MLLGRAVFMDFDLAEIYSVGMIRRGEESSYCFHFNNGNRISSSKEHFHAEHVIFTVKRSIENAVQSLPCFPLKASRCELDSVSVAIEWRKTVPKARMNLKGAQNWSGSFHVLEHARLSSREFSCCRREESARCFWHFLSLLRNYNRIDWVSPCS